MKKNVFISYCSDDYNKVKTLLRKINDLKYINPIVVENNRTSMEYLSNKIIKHFNRTHFIIPILTSKSIHTQYINQELGFAKAKGIPIWPIVEQEIMHFLKGFVTSQNDLPYNFKSYSESKKESQSFRNCCDILLEDLINKINKETKKKTIGLSDIFLGWWRNEYTLADGRSGNETFRIIKNDRYYIDNKFMFKLDNIFISKDKKTIKFRKNGVNEGDTRTAFNEIHLVKKGVYTGDEQGNIVTYSKI
jgi:hypothetical protein